jgi:hypothetical protein
MPRRHAFLVAIVVAFAVAITTATGASLGGGAGTSARADRAAQQRELTVSAAHRGSAIATASRTTSRRGPRGLRGPQGAVGRQGPPGVFSAANVVQVPGPSVALCMFGAGTCAVGSSIATCPPGKVVIGGGWDGETNPPLSATVGYNEPTSPTTWSVVMVNDDNTTTASFHAVATCAG